jgi:hypothetical protein
VACIIFDYLFKGTISLYFERGGGGRGWRGGAQINMLGEGGGTHGTGTELAKIDKICHHKRYT